MVCRKDMRFLFTLLFDYFFSLFASLSLAYLINSTAFSFMDLFIATGFQKNSCQYRRQLTGCVS